MQWTITEDDYYQILADTSDLIEAVYEYDNEEKEKNPTRRQNLLDVLENSLSVLVSLHMLRWRDKRKFMYAVNQTTDFWHRPVDKGTYINKTLKILDEAVEHTADKKPRR